MFYVESFVSILSNLVVSVLSIVVLIKIITITNKIELNLDGKKTTEKKVEKEVTSTKKK